MVAERAALEAHASRLPGVALEAIPSVEVRHSTSSGVTIDFGATNVVLLDPVGRPRAVRPGSPGPEDASGAMAALARGVELMQEGIGDALVTLPVAKREIARHVDPGFRGHTGYLASACGLGTYGRDYLMTFLAPDLQVALLSTHLPLRRALEELETGRILDALRCLSRCAGGRIAVAGLNPHAGEGGLLGDEEIRCIAPAVEAARDESLPVDGPFSPDSLFARARRGEFDWVLALYHDQGLIAVKTASFGTATNWTLGLPWIRTSVDHGTAYDLAGTGRADVEPLARVVETTLRLIDGRLPRPSEEPGCETVPAGS